VERTGDARAFEGLGGTKLGAECHQTRHFVFRQTNLVAAGLGQGKISDLEVERGTHPSIIPEKTGQKPLQALSAD
jgi:hypothetical protein